MLKYFIIFALVCSSVSAQDRVFQYNSTFRNESVGLNLGVFKASKSISEDPNFKVTQNKFTLFNRTRVKTKVKVK